GRNQRGEGGAPHPLTGRPTPPAPPGLVPDDVSACALARALHRRVVRAALVSVVCACSQSRVWFRLPCSRHQPSSTLTSACLLGPSLLSVTGVPANSPKVGVIVGTPLGDRDPVVYVKG